MVSGGASGQVVSQDNKPLHLHPGACSTDHLYFLDYGGYIDVR